MQTQLDSLRIEVSSLRAELADLRAQLADLRQVVVGPEQAAAVSLSPRVAESEFSLVSEVHPPPGNDCLEDLRPLSIPASPAGYPADPPSGELDWPTRERICRQIGLFVEGALRGEITGTSGRERLPYRSRFYLVVRDFGGQQFDPPRVFSRWTVAQRLVERASGFGRSVFVGLPSKREVSVVVDSAGLRQPHYDQ